MAVVPHVCRKWRQIALSYPGFGLTSAYGPSRAYEADSWMLCSVGTNKHPSPSSTTNAWCGRSSRLPTGHRAARDPGAQTRPPGADSPEGGRAGRPRVGVGDGGGCVEGHCVFSRAQYARFLIPSLYCKYLIPDLVQNKHRFHPVAIRDSTLLSRAAFFPRSRHQMLSQPMIYVGGRGIVSQVRVGKGLHVFSLTLLDVSALCDVLLELGPDWEEAPKRLNHAQCSMLP